MLTRSYCSVLTRPVPVGGWSVRGCLPIVLWHPLKGCAAGPHPRKALHHQAVLGHCAFVRVPDGTWKPPKDVFKLHLDNSPHMGGLCLVRTED